MRIAFFTTTRAEFGILSSFIKAVVNHPVIEYYLFVGGTHLKSEYGNTIDEIRDMGLQVTEEFDYVSEKDDTYSLVQSASRCNSLVGNIFTKYSFDFICILGDRYELVPIVFNAIMFRVPIIHWGGGETTSGVIDEQIRHMVTKASHIHFPACQAYADNIIMMGEEDWRVKNVGSLIVETILNTKRIPRNDLYEDLKLNLQDPVIIITYHPVTSDPNFSNFDQMKNIMEAINGLGFQVVITGPNLEVGREQLMRYIHEEVSENANAHFFNSLGIRRFHSLLAYSSFIIGNSSSGLFEAPLFKTPTINVGDRQEGRYKHPSVIDVNYDIESIKQGIRKAISPDFLESIKDMKYAFGDGNAAKIAIEMLLEIFDRKDIMIKKLNYPGI